MFREALAEVMIVELSEEKATYGTIKDRSVSRKKIKLRGLEGQKMCT